MKEGKKNTYLIRLYKIIVSKKKKTHSLVVIFFSLIFL